MEIQMELGPSDAEMVGLGPKKKVNPFFAATEMERAGNLTGAEKIYKTLLDSSFGNVCIQAALGMNYAVQGAHGLANVLLSSALKNFDRFDGDLAEVGIINKHIPSKTNPDSFAKLKKSEIMNAIGTTWKHENNVKQARYWFERAQNELSLPNADIQNNLATLFINEGHPERSFPHLNKALEVDPEHSQAHWNLSLVHLELGDYAKGFDEYKWGKRAAVRMNRNYTKQPTPEWDGSKGKTVVVYGEQGIGDEIMFASLIPDLMRDCKTVIFDCHKKLHRLFANSFPQLDIYPTREDENITWAIKQDGTYRYPIDAQVAIGDLPRFYRRDIKDFPGTPYIKPTGEANLKWAEKLNALFSDGKPVIGINWIGGHKKTRVEVRSLTLEQMLPVLSQDAHFVSLQYTPCEDEIAAFEQAHGIKIHHWPEAAYNEHYDETAGLVANLDLVITCCSSVVHLAGSMGVPAWVLTPSRPAWRYRLDMPTMPWYGNTVTLFRQAPDTVAWEPVVDEASEALKELIDAQQQTDNRADSGTGGTASAAGADASGDSGPVRSEPGFDYSHQTADGAQA